MSLDRWIVGIALLTVLQISAPAYAQSDGVLAVGAEWGLRGAVDRNATGSQVIGFTWRFGRPEEGWSWDWALNWFGTDVQHSISGTPVALGELRVHPLMAGYGYTHAIGRFSIRGAVFGGYAWNSFSLDPAATELYRRQAGTNSVSSSASDSVSSSVSNTWVVKPEFRLRYDVSRRVGLNVS